MVHQGNSGAGEPDPAVPLPRRWPRRDSHPDDTSLLRRRLVFGLSIIKRPAWLSPTPRVSTSFHDFLSPC